MASDVGDRLALLTTIAPSVDVALLRVLAGVLARGPGVDALLLIADGLGEAAVLVGLDGRVTMAMQIAELAEVFSREAARPRPACFWSPGFW